MKIYIIKNQDGSILGKDLEWLDGTDASLVFSAPHRDIALNQLIELNAKDINLRAQLVDCEADKKGYPIVLLESAAAAAKDSANTIQSDAA